MFELLGSYGMASMAHHGHSSGLGYYSGAGSGGGYATGGFSSPSAISAADKMMREILYGKHQPQASTTAATQSHSAASVSGPSTSNASPSGSPDSDGDSFRSLEQTAKESTNGYMAQIERNAETMEFAEAEAMLAEKATLDEIQTHVGAGEYNGEFYV